MNFIELWNTNVIFSTHKNQFYRRRGLIYNPKTSQDTRKECFIAVFVKTWQIIINSLYSLSSNNGTELFNYIYVTNRVLAMHPIWCGIVVSQEVIYSTVFARTWSLKWCRFQESRRSLKLSGSKWRKFSKNFVKHFAEFGNFDIYSFIHCRACCKQSGKLKDIEQYFRTL